MITVKEKLADNVNHDISDFAASVYTSHDKNDNTNYMLSDKNSLWNNSNAITNTMTATIVKITGTNNLSKTYVDTSIKTSTALFHMTTLMFRTLYQTIQLTLLIYNKEHNLQSKTFPLSIIQSKTNRSAMKSIMNVTKTSNVENKPNNNNRNHTNSNTFKHNIIFCQTSMSLFVMYTKNCKRAHGFEFLKLLLQNQLDHHEVDDHYLNNIVKERSTNSKEILVTFSQEIFFAYVLPKEIVNSAVMDFKRQRPICL